MTNPTVAELAAGLTDAQKRAVRALDGQWRLAPSCVTRQAVAALSSKLCERGWPNGRNGYAMVQYRLSLLGLEVRHHLSSQETTHAE
jgi:hypothetical protein